ncbi:hypothetical protein F4779DRAFT_15736 [Xylariaceae sp. FL0662B]|nr:hypothetical protein F4779DRAFT_15736 [Xylariaceae sp. FL0662B]
MGLPLFVAPVETDVPGKTAPKSPVDPATTRSPIRRAERDRRRQLHEIREHRLRMLAALEEGDDDINLLSTSRSSPRTRIAPGETDGPSPRNEDPELAPEVLDLILFRDRGARDSAFDFGHIDVEDINNLRAESIASDAWPSHMRAAIARRRQALSRGEPFVPAPVTDRTYTPSSTMRAAVARRREVLSARREALPYAHASSRSDAVLPGYLSARDIQAEQHAPRSLLDLEPLPRRVSSPHRVDRSRPAQLSRGASRLSNRVRYVDGLGDRDRSLSPEGDGVWDTLQSTLTPDPQPPSVGSSFASTTASAATSQSTAASSSNTPITSPDDEAEPLHYSVHENLSSNDEGDDDADEERIEHPRLPGPRRYADFVCWPEDLEDL